MQEIVNVIVQNGLGVASFIALIYFINTTLKDLDDALKEISKTLNQIQLNLIELNARVNKIEKREE